MRSVLLLLSWFLPLAIACSDDGTGPGNGTLVESSFESGFEGFAVDGTDLDDPPVDWEIERSMELAFDGAWSVRLELDNLNDAGKIWIERRVELEPNQSYDVDVDYAFASADFGDINAWTIIAGAVPMDPETADDLPFRGSTANGEQEGHVWLERSHEQTLTTGPEGEAWVAFGVWGTSEFPRTYYVDDVRVVFHPR